jgi:Ca2+-dependent lipid-binding protein
MAEKPEEIIQLSDPEHIVVFKEKTETSHTLDLAKIEIIIEEARNLKNTDLFSKSDPYVIFQVFDKTVKTGVIQNNLNPQWKARFTAVIAYPHKQDVMIKFTVMDEDMLKDDYLGRVTLQLSALKAHREVVDQWFPLLDMKGELRLIMQTQSISSIDEETNSKMVAIQKEQEKTATMHVTVQTVLHELEVTKKLRQEDQRQAQQQYFQLQNTYEATAKALTDASTARDHYQKELVAALKENETLKAQPQKSCCLIL